MRSVTEQGALDEFLSTAELAGTDFTAEKMNNVKIIHTDQRNPYLLSAAEERSTVKKQSAHRSRLTVPRRPRWDESTSKEELDAKERASLLDWRRGLAELQESNDLLMTPFERNLEVWRQLWRVIERSDLVVQIVDARHPLLFRSDDLERYVKEVDGRKNNLLLVNKADMMTLTQRQAWADYFERSSISYKFFSASLARERNEARHADDGEGDDANDDVTGDTTRPADAAATDGQTVDVRDRDDEDASWVGEEDAGSRMDTDASSEDPRTRILTVDELEELFLEHAPPVAGRSDVWQQRAALNEADGDSGGRIEVGLVGYPNVGKSSTINALIGAKKVSVSSTPGKTKHFQTIHLSPSVVLCDCPGLVFPNFATTKAELVCNGILPIDQLREFTGPAGLVTQRIPQSFLEALYGVKIQKRPLEEGGTGVPTAEELLVAYATARGFTKTGQGQPDESRAARYVLKDYVSGKLLFCHPPPGDPAIDPLDFNRELYDEEHLPQKRRAALALPHPSLPDTDELSAVDGEERATVPTTQGPKSSRLDQRFFAPGTGSGSKGRLSMPFNHKYSDQATAAGKQLSGRKQRTMIALEKNVDPADVRALNGKKHFKGGKRNGKSKDTLDAGL